MIFVRSFVRSLDVPFVCPNLFLFVERDETTRPAHAWPPNRQIQSSVSFLGDRRRFPVQEFGP